MTLRDVVWSDAPNGAILHRPASAVRSCDRSIRALLDDLIDTMRATPTAVGLAAPQVGVPWRVIVAEVEGRLVQLVNPSVRRSSAEIDLQWESCLSTPDLMGAVPTPTGIVVSGLDRKGRPQRIIAAGLLARVLRHETDHLDGVLFTKRMVGRPFLISEVQAKGAEAFNQHIEDAVTEASGMVASGA